MDRMQGKGGLFGKEGDRLYADCRSHIDAVRALRDKIVGASGLRTRENSLDPLAEIDIHLDAGLNRTELLQSVHPDEQVREAAETAHQEMSDLASGLGLDRALYDALVALERDLASTDPVERRFIERNLRDFRRSGVDREEAVRERIRALRAELVRLSQEFGRNIRNDTRAILLDGPEELDGLPPDYFAAHRPGEDGKIRITTDYPDLIPFMSYARSGARRKQLYLEYNNRAYPENIGVLGAILAKRRELAALLGYPSYAAYASEDKMVKTAERIREFIEEIAAIASGRARDDWAALLERKRRDDPGASEVNDWEKGYLQELVKAETLLFDSQALRPYLPYGRVKEGVLSVTEKLFGLEYRRIGEPAWHPSVESYEVLKEGKPIGRFHLDMHPREGKYKHAAMFPVKSGVAGRQLPEAALVCNFPDPAAGDGPALLDHGDLVTFFHEFGHLLHHILGGAARYVRFSGVSTEWDFVEAPSQLLEEWAFRHEILAQFARHAETGQPVPEEMVARMNKARSFGRGIGVRQQMFYAALALTYHGEQPAADTTAILKDLQARYSLFPYVEATHFQASFGHLDGYSALYYTYMWSLVIARDLLSPFAQGSLMDTALAVRYRKAVLEPGGSRDAADLIRDFLGRDYRLDAYRVWLSE